MINRFRRHLTTVTLAATAIALAACSDSTVEPTKSASNTLAPAGVHLTVASTAVTTATLYPQYDNVYIDVNGNKITIPAYSICDIATSGYSTSLWNAPCAPQTAPIVFTITTSTKTDGSQLVTVQPDVRFSPTKTVMAFFKDSVAAKSSNPVIAYCKLTGCYDEGKYDAQMVTYRDPVQGIVYRRLKHFSGYNVVFGLGDGSGDGSSGGMNMIPLPANFMSGYITTVGFDGFDGSRSTSDAIR